jgi:hypothetical protein
VRPIVAHAAVALAIAACGCAHRATPQDLADATTRAVYAADYDTTTANFDDALRSQVTRKSVGDLSDRMHAYGTYHGLKETAADQSAGRYQYEASFDKGPIAVLLRVDPDGKIAAYRIGTETAFGTVR